MIMCFNFLRNWNYVYKISSRNSELYKCLIKIYLESFASIYHLYHLFGIMHKSIFYNLNASHQWVGSSVKPSVSGVTSSKMPLGFLVYAAVVWHIVYYFSQLIATFDLKLLLVFSYSNASFNWSNSLVPFSFLLRHYNGQYSQMEIEKRWIATIK